MVAEVTIGNDAKQPHESDASMLTTCRLITSLTCIMTFDFPEGVR